MKSIYTIIIYLLFINLALSAQDILTIGEVYDFDIGDEFHRRSKLNNQPPNAERSTILDKWYSGSLDTLWYKVYRDKYQADINFNDNPPTLDYRFYKDTVAISVTNLDSSVFSLYPYFYYDSLANDMGVDLYYDSIIDYSSSLCESLLNGVDYYIGIFEPDRYWYVYGQGLGTVKEFYMEGSALGYASIDRYMFYYKKKGIECGTPDLRTGINTNKINNIFSLYPNPASEEIWINTSLLSRRLEYSILDLTVREYKKGVVHDIDNQRISLTELQSGMYFMILKENNAIIGVRQFVKN